MKKYYLAQVNIAKMLAPIDSPVMADFVNNLDRINALAERSDGFIWRLKDGDDATSLQLFIDDFLIINMSVWESKEALFRYTYKSDHVQIFARRKEWFHNMKEMHMAFWYIEEGTIPTPDDAKERLNYLNEHGETPYSFTFKSKFTVEESSTYKPNN
ncbi:MAG: hypothetical protein COA50_14510 [Flavobacteriaceae bacterium]|nr:MAG: hypothetical protein COA50_14510 [Flavobacteriaceae bacterium]